MKVAMASSAGHARTNEDFVGAAQGAVVLLDGAGIPGSEAQCRHGTAWYSHTLGGSLLGSLSRTPEVSLVAALADAIEFVASQHRDTCDLLHPNSPQASAAVVRIAGHRLDYLVLGDIFVVGCRKVRPITAESALKILLGDEPSAADLGRRKCPVSDPAPNCPHREPKPVGDRLSP